MKVEIWSDIACPWCFVGKRRFETALERFDEDVEVVWRSFELDPGAPKTSEKAIDVALARKYGMSLEQAQGMLDTMTRNGADEGIEFRFDRLQSGNTFDAHRLLHLARKTGQGDAMKERLLLAYFTEGVAMSDREALVRLAGEVGLDEEEVRETLSNGEYGAEVRQDQAAAYELGVRGVPFFLIEGKYGVSGAQPPETLLDVLRRARSEMEASDPADAPGCDATGCDVR